MLQETKSYIEDKDKLIALTAEKEVIKEEATRQEAQADKRRDDAIDLIRDQHNKEVIAIRDKVKAQVDPIEHSIYTLIQNLQDVSLKIVFLKHQEKIKEKKLEFTAKVTAYRNKEVAELGSFYNDEFTIIKLFAAQNNRPKNRWTLMIIGNTLLGELVKMPWEYSLPVHVDGANIAGSLKYLPTLKEIKDYVENKREHLRVMVLSAYKNTKKKYLETINNYSLEDFKEILEPRKVSRTKIPILFRITRYDEVREYCMYQGFYYVSSDVTDNPFNYINIDGTTHVRLCRPEQLRITETGNTMFGDWWSIRIEQSQRGILFNRENWAKTITDAEDRIEELNRNRSKKISFRNRSKKISFNPPQVEWMQ